jgi:hypothetical protein
MLFLYTYNLENDHKNWGVLQKKLLLFILAEVVNPSNLSHDATIIYEKLYYYLAKGALNISCW